MKNAILATIALGTVVLTSCGSDPYYPDHGGRPPGGQYPGGGGGGGGASAYGSGQRDGARDARSGRRYDPSRNQGSVPRPFQDSYRNGYASGYRSNGGGGGGGGGHYPGGGGGGNWGGGGGGNWGGDGGGNWGGGGGGSQYSKDAVWKRAYAIGQYDSGRGIGFKANEGSLAYPPELRSSYYNGYKSGFDSLRKKNR